MTDPAGTDSQEGALSLDTYYEQELPGAPAVSPDGERVAFVVNEFDADEEEGVTSLFVAPTDGSREPHRLTRVSDASDPAWSPDGTKLGFLATRDADAELRASTTKDDDEEEAEDEEEDEDNGDDDDQADEAEADDTGADDDTDGEDDEGEDDEGADDDESAFGEDEQQLFVFDVEWGGDARQVTTRDHGVKEFDWAPDGERVVVSAKDPTEEQAEYLEERTEDGPIEIERVQHKANGFGWTDEAKTYLFVVDVESRETERLDDAYATGAAAALRGDTLSPSWGAANRIAFTSYQHDDADDTWAIDLHTIAPDGSDHRVLTDGTVRVGGYAWDPTGDRLAYVAADPANLYLAPDVVVRGDDVDSDSSRLAADEEYPRYDLEWAGEETLLLATGDHGQSVLQRLDVTTDESEQIYPTPEDDQNGLALYRPFDVAADRSVAAFIETNAQDFEVVTMDLEDALANAPVPAVAAGPDASAGDGADGDAGGILIQVTETNQAIEDAVDIDCERISFQSGDADEDVTVHGLAYRPADADLDAETYPVVVDIHGGPTVYDQPIYQYRYHYWVSHGYVVLNVNYRGSTSYGDDFAEAIRGEWGPRESQDVAAGVDDLVDRGWVDPERVFVTGFSQGGINTAFVLANTDVATAGAAEHGIYDFYSSYGTDDCHAWWDAEFGQPWDDPESYYELSSITKVDDIEDPLLLTAGENDWRCPPTQAEQMYVAVKKQGVDAKLVVYPELAHAYGPPETATHRLETVTDWFREHDPAIDVDEADDDTDPTDRD